MSILWSDDCLSCLCNLPHTLEEHMKAVELAHMELQSVIQDLERITSRWEQDAQVQEPECPQGYDWNGRQCLKHDNVFRLSVYEREGF